MKKIIFTLLIGLLGVSMAFAQNAQSITEISGGGNRAITDLVCPEGSVYSQTPDGLNGYSYVAGYYYSDNLITEPSAPVTKITWWMLEAMPDANLAFDIFIQADNAGQPGTLIASFFDVDFTAVNTGEFSFNYPVYEYSFTLPTPLTIAAGTWIGIRDLPDYADYTHHHYWATSSDGDSFMWYGEGYSGVDDLAFCLGGGAPTPVSGWALGIGFMMILAFSIYRIRRP
jgi:hypothetical protein